MQRNRKRQAIPSIALGLLLFGCWGLDQVLGCISTVQGYLLAANPIDPYNRTELTSQSQPARRQPDHTTARSITHATTNYSRDNPVSCISRFFPLNFLSIDIRSCSKSPALPRHIILAVDIVGPCKPATRRNLAQLKLACSNPPSRHCTLFRQIDSLACHPASRIQST